MRAFYNEIDRYCCDWLQNLMDAGLITPGKIDDRSIADLNPDDCRGYERCHFFAGIAGWELALSLSGYTGPVWTGSCPCQPFSAAGKGKASGDERHLWPVWFELIRACRPPVIFGEQVEAAIGWGWLDLVHSDLEPEGYTVGAAVLPACGVGAPHIRQRLWFVAKSGVARTRRDVGSLSSEKPPSRWGDGAVISCSATGELADADGRRRMEPIKPGKEQSEGRVSSGELADAKDSNRRRPVDQRNGWWRPSETGRSGPWSNLFWLPCTDGKQRPTGVEYTAGDGRIAWGSEPSWWGAASGCSTNGQGPTKSCVQPLAHGVPARVAKLRAAGNAIVPQVAAEFIKASMT